MLWGEVARSARPLHGRTHLEEWIESKPPSDPAGDVSSGTMHATQSGSPLPAPPGFKPVFDRSIRSNGR